MKSAMAVAAASPDANVTARPRSSAPRASSKAPHPGLPSRPYSSDASWTYVELIVIAGFIGAPAVRAGRPAWTARVSDVQDASSVTGLGYSRSVMSVGSLRLSPGRTVGTDPSARRSPSGADWWPADRSRVGTAPQERPMSASGRGRDHQLRRLAALATRVEDAVAVRTVDPDTHGPVAGHQARWQRDVHPGAGRDRPDVGKCRAADRRRVRPGQRRLVPCRGHRSDTAAVDTAVDDVQAKLHGGDLAAQTLHVECQVRPIDVRAARVRAEARIGPVVACRARRLHLGIGADLEGRRPA